MKLTILTLLLFMLETVCGQTYTLSGIVLDSKTKKPVEYASVWIEGSSSGAITDIDGTFIINNIYTGNYNIVVKYIGYLERKQSLYVNKDIDGMVVYLSEQTLELNEVTITAEKKNNEAATSYTLNRTALDHLQSVSVSDALSLLPGEQTGKYRSLASSKQIITLRGETSEMGNPSFGTVVEMDGVRLAGNAGTITGGTDLRNVGNSNIERIDVVTGIPSVEYGDLTNGVVKLVTRRGKSPLTADISVRPGTQSYSVSKGVGLGGHSGVLNISYEHLRSVSDIASPYTSYTRNAFGMKYSNAFHFNNGQNLSMEMTLNGNLGGQNSKSDPDAFKNTYTIVRDDAVWTALSFNYMINSPWLSNLRWGVTFSYSDKYSEMRENRSSSSSQPAIHAVEEGYFVATKYDDDPNGNIILLPTGYWYLDTYNDNRPINYSSYIKARWYHKIGGVSSNLLSGVELRGDGNLGRGEYYTDMSLAPTWREYRLDELPYVNNLAAYIEEDIMIPFVSSRLNIKAGLRNDMTFISGSDYGNVSSLSPRMSMKYSFGEKDNGFFRGMTVRGGWGKAVKLPSFEKLYPRETYVDRLAFAPGTMADGTTYYAYHVMPVSPIYNKDLEWQYSVMREIGTDVRFKGVRMSLSLYYNTIYNPYTDTRVYSPFQYKLTDQSALNGCMIPVSDRQYSIDKNTGIVTVSDRTETYSPQQLEYKQMNDLHSAAMSVNGSSSSRMGVEWVVDFDKIKSIGTSFRLDGKFYRYKGVDEVIVPSTSNIKGTDGQPYKYIGYYAGGNTAYNGFESRRLNTNLTVVTHIPKIRMIFSLRFEGTFINSRQNISEYDGKQRSFALDSRDDFLPSSDGKDIYSGDGYVATYPLYYVSRDNMEEKIPFIDKFLWAYQNDRELYNELSKLVVKSSTGYMFKKQGYSPYFSANLNVTKEIGKYLSLSFFANNFFYSMQKIKNWQTGTENSLFASGLVTPFNYGISFKLKL